MPISPRTYDVQAFDRRSVGAGLCPARWLFVLFCSFCLRRGTFFIISLSASGGVLSFLGERKYPKNGLRKGGFRFPPFLKNLFPLKRPKREGGGPPSLETPSGGFGDYQIAPLPRSGKGRWRPLAAVGMRLCNGVQALGSPSGRAVTAGD